MKQIFHIFRKDCRHFWPEALTCVLVTAIFARIYPLQWIMRNDTSPFSFRGLSIPAASPQTAAAIVATLLPLSWFVLIVRMVQDECLVGERPYWFTRPFDWPKLLAAKALFLVSFLAVPFAAAQTAIMVEAGFHPSHEIRRLTVFVVATLAGLTLPIVWIATVTRNFFRSVLTTLGLLILLGAMAVFMEEGPFNTHVTTPYSDEISFPLLLTVLIGCVVSQYATRRTWLARTMIAALVPTLFLLGLNPVEPELLERRYYPLIPNAIPIDIALATEPGADGTLPRLRTGFSDNKKSLSLTVPLSVSGVPYGYAVVPDDVRVRIIAADGSSWTSPWHNIYSRSYRHETEQGEISVDINRAFYERVRSRSVALEVSLALTQVEASDPVHTAIPSDGRELVVPHFAICALASKLKSGNNSLTCRYPFGEPQRTQVTAFLSGEPCHASPASLARSFPATTSTGSLSPDPINVFLSAINDSDLSFGFQQNSDMETDHGGYLCPGAPVILTPYHVVRRARYSFTTQNLQLPEWTGLVTQFSRP